MFPPGLAHQLLPMEVKGELPGFWGPKPEVKREQHNRRDGSWNPCLKTKAQTSRTIYVYLYTDTSDFLRISKTPLCVYIQLGLRRIICKTNLFCLRCFFAVQGTSIKTHCVTMVIEFFSFSGSHQKIDTCIPSLLAVVGDEFTKPFGVFIRVSTINITSPQRHGGIALGFSHAVEQVYRQNTPGNSEKISVVGACRCARPSLSIFQNSNQVESI